jgi:hypothetical protein
MSDWNYYTAKGQMWFSYKDKNIETCVQDFDSFEKDMNEKHYPIYDLMSGEDFYRCVDGGGFIDYDGSLAEVFVDGYSSNLGLRHRGLNQGKFMVDGKTWLKICKAYKVEVNWANK